MGIDSEVMRIVLCALGLMLFFEGIPYFAFPSKTREFFKTLQEMPDRILRVIGLVSIIIGSLVVFFVAG